MEKKLDSYDKAWVGVERPDLGEVKRKRKTIRVKKKKTNSDRLEDMRTVGSMCIMILKFFVLLNLLVITGRML
ncbi:MAG: hypothetical protein PUI98_07040 [Finegoldia magna]|nr:hypothetical protein [Finegoldia magna]